MAEILAQVIRNDRVESIHCGHIVVVTPAGEVVQALGDSRMRTYMRSAAKPFQSMPLLESSVVKQLGLTVKELAVTMASHNGEEFHLQAVRSLLAKAGLAVEDLRCGFHRPLHPPCADQWLLHDHNESPLYNNCSGKHAGMLVLAKGLETPLATYLQPVHPVQQRIQHKLAIFSGVPEEEIETGIDGCSAPVFYLPLKNMALAYARLAEGKISPSEQVFKIMSANPEMVAGSGRFDTALMRITNGRMVSKTGAEGIRCLGIRAAQPLGIALKIADGNARVSAVVMLEVLNQLQLILPQEFAHLHQFYRPTLINCAGIEIGEIRAQFELS
ncbi:MAG: asparaginase [bacterium]